MQKKITASKVKTLPKNSEIYIITNNERVGGVISTTRKRGYVLSYIKIIKTKRYWINLLLDSTLLDKNHIFIQKKRLKRINFKKGIIRYKIQNVL